MPIFAIWIISFTVDGQWGNWGQWTDCSLSCRGMIQRTLPCDNPPPQHGGKDCEGKAEEEKTEKKLCDKSDCTGKPGLDGRHESLSRRDVHSFSPLIAATRGKDE